MKKLILCIAAMLAIVPSRADEGMWIPMLIGKNYDDMVREGLTLTKDDLYSINHSSLKDAIVQFAGGCTAEMISPSGLLLTNHHCGYDAVATLSTVENDLLDNGFWAHSIKEELPAQGVTVIFLQYMKDVTDEVKAAVGNATGEEYNKKFEEVRKKIEARESNNGKLVANVRDFFNGNQFLLLVYKRYTDVRLVAAPPKSLGKFGGETDNWMWPRHTADFSMFRVYADSNNEPAAYSAHNVPYKPKQFLPISLKGEHEKDYAMIYGYPGRTNRYEVSYGVDEAINIVNPSIVAIRDLRLSIMRRHMDKDKAVYLKLTSLYARIANYWKYYIGQTEQLKRLNVVDKKRKQEAKFVAWAKENKTDEKLTDEFSDLYGDYGRIAKYLTYNSECFRASALARLGSTFLGLSEHLEKGVTNKDTLDKYVEQIQQARKVVMKEFDLETEKDMLAEMTQLFAQQIPREQLPDVYDGLIFAKYGRPEDKSTYVAYADAVFRNTFLVDSNAFNEFCKAPSLEKLRKDMAVQYALSFVNNYNKNYQPREQAFYDKRFELRRTYIHDLMAWKKDKAFYPDANSTMRITYGKVNSYDPQDGVHYKYYTTLDGVMAKYKPGSDEFDVPAKLLDLYKAKDYGQYADEDGTLHTCFITDNDITGGNSGSPVINGRGELLGAAFDGNWEAMSGDIAFDKKYKRTIVCDIRYILFLVDKMGHANNLINEMDIRK